MGETALSKSRAITIKDLVYIVVMTASLLGSYYAIASRVTVLELELKQADKEIAVLTKEIASFKDLPGDVESLTKLSIEIGKTVDIIRDGLIAKGIIKPRSD